MKLKLLNINRRVIFAAAALFTVVLISCSTHNINNKDLKTKNIADYFNLLSEQKIVKGKISLNNGVYMVKMDGCYGASYLNVNLIKSSIHYVYDNQCAGPPPEYTVTIVMAVSNDKTPYFHIKSDERTFGDKDTSIYKFTGAGFEKIPVKVLPAEIAESFKSL